LESGGASLGNTGSYWVTITRVREGRKTTKTMPTFYQYEEEKKVPATISLRLGSHKLLLGRLLSNKWISLPLFPAEKGRKGKKRGRWTLSINHVAMTEKAYEAYTILQEKKTKKICHGETGEVRAKMQRVHQFWQTKPAKLIPGAAMRKKRYKIEISRLSKKQLKLTYKKDKRREREGSEIWFKAGIPFWGCESKAETSGGRGGAMRAERRSANTSVLRGVQKIRQRKNLKKRKTDTKKGEET